MECLERVEKQLLGQASLCLQQVRGICSREVMLYVVQDESSVAECSDWPQLWASSVHVARILEQVVAAKPPSFPSYMLVRSVSRRSILQALRQSACGYFGPTKLLVP